jgi:hypothetical protein
MVLLAVAIGHTGDPVLSSRISRAVRSFEQDVGEPKLIARAQAAKREPEDAMPQMRRSLVDDESRYCKIQSSPADQKVQPHFDSPAGQRW